MQGLNGKGGAEHLEATDPSALATIGLVASSAYYIAPEVHAALGYPGQQSRPATAEEEDDYLVDGLLQPVIDRGPVYRPTPDSVQED